MEERKCGSYCKQQQKPSRPKTDLLGLGLGEGGDGDGEGVVGEMGRTHGSE